MQSMTLAEFQALAPREARRQALGALPEGYKGSFDTHTPRRVSRERAKLANAVRHEGDPRHQRRDRTRKVRVFG